MARSDEVLRPRVLTPEVEEWKSCRSWPRKRAVCAYLSRPDREAFTRWPVWQDGLRDHDSVSHADTDPELNREGVCRLQIWWRRQGTETAGMPHQQVRRGAKQPGRTQQVGTGLNAGLNLLRRTRELPCLPQH